MWVYRAGKSSRYYNHVIENERIYIFWENLNFDLRDYANINEYKSLVAKAFETNNIVTVSNLSCQLDYFCNKMEIGDYVIIPSEHSKWYTLTRIIGEYKYEPNESLYIHSRKIEVIKDKMYRDDFPIEIQYSLGAFRTLFHAKREKEIIEIMKKKYNIDLECGE